MRLIEFLIKEDVGMNETSSELEGYNLFIVCAETGERELCELLVERGADPTTKREDGGNALHSAAQDGGADVCRNLVEDCGLDINAEWQDEFMNQRTSLYEVTRTGQVDLCEYLLSNGAYVDAGYQPLIAAAWLF
jgi:26S proteasome non-ATPase regulatory subunit 10